MFSGLALAFVPAFVLGAAGCGQEQGDARVWSPDDHQQPSAQVDPSQGAPPEDEPQGGPPSAETVAQAAAALYRASCGGCHGVDGRGNGPSLPAGIVAPDMTLAAVQGRSDEELARVIREGRGVMPGFGSQLNDRGIEALVTHVRTLRQP